MNNVLKYRASIFLNVLLVLLAVAVSGVPSWGDENGFASITGVSVTGGEASPSVVISADKTLVYSYYKLADPPRAILDLAQTDAQKVPETRTMDSGLIRKIDVSTKKLKSGRLTRIQIALAKDADFTVKPDGKNTSSIVVAFAVEPAQPTAQPVGAGGAGNSASATAPPDPAPQTSEKAAAPDATAATSPPVTTAGERGPLALTAVTPAETGADIVIDGGAPTFRAFRLTRPERLVVDLQNVKKAIREAQIPLKRNGLVDARLGSYPDKTRIVFDAQNGTFDSYRVDPVASGLRLVVGKAAEATAAVPPPAEPAVGSASAPVAAAQEPQGAAAAKSNAEGTIAEAKTSLESKAAEEPAASKKTDQQRQASVDAIDFRKHDGYSRLSVKTSPECAVEKPERTAEGLVLTLRGCALPKRLQRSINTSGFEVPVQRVTPYQLRKPKGGYDTKIVVAVTGEPDYELKQDGNFWHLDVKTPTVQEVKKGPAPPVAVAAAPADTASAPDRKVAAPLVEKKTYTGRRVTLEFADADIRKIFQLLAEVSNMNFLIADDVNGTISIKLVNVPWDQALDVILDSKNLEKKVEGNIVQIKPKGKFKTQDEEEAEAKKAKEKLMPLQTKVFDVNFASLGDVESQFNKLRSSRPDANVTSDPRTNKIIVNDIEPRIQQMRDLLNIIDIPEKQVMIEARIVEASSTFTRDLGINWGVHYRDATASIAGINSLDSGFGGIVTKAPTSDTGSVAGGSAGISFGTLGSNVRLDLRLSAAVTAGQVKIISSPKIATLNNKAAKISQGQSIPYQNTTAVTGAVTQFVEAALTLEVTPHINPDGSVIMKIKASNDAPGTGNPPPINKKEATTELLVRDGETTVIGGIYVDSDTEENTGVPFLSEIPLLGWLFKSNTKTKTKTELLIFITPRILA